jgi:hypothetical protein
MIIRIFFSRHTALSILLAASVLSDCGVGKITNSIDQAVNVIDRGIDNINHDSTRWQSTLREVSDQLPKDIQSTIRNEMSQLVERSIAKTGVEFRCDVDFLAQRAKQGLERIKAMLLNKQPVPVSPSFCHVSPGTLNINAPPQSRSTIELAGYDMDQNDQKGHALKVFLFSDRTGESIPFTEDRIGRTTHYLLTLNVTGADLETLIRNKQISKLKVSWNDTAAGLPEVLVIQRVAQRKTVTVPLGEITHIPSHAGGDADFNTSGSDPLDYSVTGESRVDGNRILVRIHMRGRERKPDNTTVDSWTDWQAAYNAPLGWKIVSCTPVGASNRSGSITDHGVLTLKLPQGEVVNRFDIFGDRENTEAGSYTRVIVYFNPVTVVLEELIQ